MKPKNIEKSSSSQIRRLSAILLVIPLIAGISPSWAIQGGTSAPGNPYAVALDIRLSATTGQRCTGGLVGEQIIATAGHCVVSNGVPIDADSIRIYSPGATVGEPLEAKLVKVFFPADYSHRSNNSEPNDIAFLLFDRKIGTPSITKIADYATVQQIVAAKAQITLYGYGITGRGEMASSIAKSIVETPIEQIGLAGFAGFERTYINYKQSDLAAACSGDSGGPAVATFNGETYLVSVHSASSGACANSSSEIDSNWGTIPGQYADLYTQALALAPTVLIKPTPTPTPVVTETPMVTQSPVPSKRKTIICVKGKVVKKVSGTNPKCPSGYKKK